MTKQEIKEMKKEINKAAHGLSTNVDEPFDKHEIVFVDEVFKILDKYIKED